MQLWEVDDSVKLHLRATQVDSENGATIVAAANSGRGMVTGMKIYDEVPDPGDPEDQLRVKSWTFGGPGLPYSDLAAAASVGPVTVPCSASPRISLPLLLRLPTTYRRALLG